MDELYLGYTFIEYAFMISYISLLLLVVYSYVRINDLKDERDYYRYLQKIREQNL